MTDFFPRATEIPQPLTAAASAYNPARVYFFGGLSGDRKVTIYNYNTMSGTFTPLGATTIFYVQSKWNTEARAATMYYNPKNGSISIVAFDGAHSIAQFGADLKVGFEYL